MVLASAASAAVIGGLIIASPTGAVAAAGAGASAGGTVRTIALAGSTAMPTAAGSGTDVNRNPRELPAFRQLLNRESAEAAKRPDAAALAAAGGSKIPTVASTAVSKTTPGLRRSFKAIDAYQMAKAFGFTVTPPDQALCVGNGYAVEMVNVALRVYRTSGGAASPAVSLNEVFGYGPAYNATTKRYGPFLTDPICLYDTSLQRFFLATLTLDVNPKTGALTLTNHLDIAVSKTSNPLGGYSIYKIAATDNGGASGPKHASCPCLGDYPHIGLDKYGFYITTNEYPWSGPGRYGNGFNGAQLYAMSKAKLAAGAAKIKVVQFQNTALAADRPGFTLWPANVPDAAYRTTGNGTEYFVSSTASQEARPKDYTAFSSNLGFYSLTNTRSLASTSPAPRLHRSVLGSQSYGQPPVAMQKVGPVPLRDCLAVGCLDKKHHLNEVEGGIDPSDTRPLTAWYADGRVFTALDTVMRVNGNLQAGVAWFSINPGAPTSHARIARQGYLGTSANNVIYPSIATTVGGRGIMNFSLVGKNHYPSQAYVKWTSNGPGDPIRVSAAGVAPLDDFCEYLTFNCGGTDSAPAIRPRFGDYSAAAVYKGQIWFANETVNSRCSFATFVKDPTCDGTRTFYANWGTRISAVTP